MTKGDDFWKAVKLVAGWWFAWVIAVFVGLAVLGACTEILG